MRYVIANSADIESNVNGNLQIEVLIVYCTYFAKIPLKQIFDMFSHNLIHCSISSKLNYLRKFPSLV